MLTVDPKVKWEEVADKVIQLTYLIPGIFFVEVVDNHIYLFMRLRKIVGECCDSSVWIFSVSDGLSSALYF